MTRASELLLARAYYLSNQFDLASAHLTRAAADRRPQPAVAAKPRRADKFKLFDESNTLLERLAASAEKTRSTAARTCPAATGGSRVAEGDPRAERQDPSSPASDTDLLAYRALRRPEPSHRRRPIVEASPPARRRGGGGVVDRATRTPENGGASAPRAHQAIHGCAGAGSRKGYPHSGEAYLRLRGAEPARAVNDASHLAPTGRPAAQIFPHAHRNTGLSAGA
jgi:hypothetical protein